VQDRAPLLMEVFDTGVQPLRPIIVKEVLASLLHGVSG
jgi:hypothetical protein